MLIAALRGGSKFPLVVLEMSHPSLHLVLRDTDHSAFRRAVCQAEAGGAHISIFALASQPFLLRH